MSEFFDFMNSFLWSLVIVSGIVCAFIILFGRTRRKDKKACGAVCWEKNDDGSDAVCSLFVHGPTRWHQDTRNKKVWP